MPVIPKIIAIFVSKFTPMQTKITDVVSNNLYSTY